MRKEHHLSQQLKLWFEYSRDFAVMAAISSELLFMAWILTGFAITPLSPLVILLVGGLISFSRPYVILKLRFGVIYRMIKRGKQLFVVSLLSMIILLFSAIVYAMPTIMILRIVPQAQITVFLESSSILTLLGLLVGSYADVFAQRRFSALCFRQALEENKPREKLKWARIALHQLKTYLSEFGITYDTSRFQRNFAIRIVDGQEIDKGLKSLYEALTSGNSPLSMLGKLTGDNNLEFVTAKMKLGRSITLDFLTKITTLLIVIINAGLLMWRLTHPLLQP